MTLIPEIPDRKTATGAPSLGDSRLSCQSFEQLRLLLEDSHDVLAEITGDGTISYVSPNVRRVFGFEADELLGANAFERVHPDDVADIRRQSVTHKGGTTCRYRHKDGSWRQVETTGRGFKQPDGTLRRALILRDLTPQARAEGIHRDDERGLGTLLANLPGMAYRRRNDAAWTMGFVSEGSRELTGYAPRDLVANGAVNFCDLIDAPDGEKARDEINAAIGARRSFEVNYCIRTAKGERKCVLDRGQAVFNDEGEFLGVEGFVMDVTERRRTERALRESEEKFAKAFRASPGALSISDIGARRFIEVNDGFLNMFGYTREEVIDQSSENLGLWESNETRHRVFALFFSQGFVRNMEVVGRTRSGDRITCLMSAERVRLNGRDCVVTSLHDVTRLRKAESERASLESQLRQAQKVEAIGALAGGIAHDFNNILAGIMAYAELARMDAEKPAQVRDYLTEIRLCSDRAKNLVQQILTFSRRQKQERVPMRIQSVIKEALNLMRSTLPSTIEIKTRIDARTPEVLADPTQIHQVLVNLCTNAAHAMRGSYGRLTLELEMCRIDSARVLTDSELQPGDHVRLSISDTGHGMDAATCNRIFEPFFTTKPPGEGTGLGLSVVLGIVREHHGAIAVKSNPGAGTNFEVFLPALQSRTGENQARTGPLPRGNGEQILIVEDEPAVCASMAMVLNRLGYRVEW